MNSTKLSPHVLCQNASHDYEWPEGDLDFDAIPPAQKADLCIEFTRRIQSELDDIIGELMDLQARYDRVQNQARRLKAELHDWCGLAEECARVAALEQQVVDEHAARLEQSRFVWEGE